MHLKWTGYGGWGDSLLKYQVLIKEGALPERLYLETIPGQDSTDYTKTRSDIIYYFIIKAVNKNGIMVSYSNRFRDSIHIPKTPAFINADYATVNAGKISLSFSFDPTSELNSYVLLRAENDTAGAYSIIHTFLAVNTNKLIFTDSLADPRVQHYYKLAAQNTCGHPMKESNPAGNIVLHATETGNQVQLSWNKYERWEGGDGNDSLMRSTPAGGWEFVATISPIDTSYTDKLVALANLDYKDKICYYVKASENNSNSYGIKGLSLSNIVCVAVPAAVRIPNAFTPNSDGLNDTFKPVFDFTPDEYLLKIFDRNGNILFQTTNSSDTWNGTDMKGHLVLQGTYVYYLRYKVQSQSVKELRGTISVLYP